MSSLAFFHPALPSLKRPRCRFPARCSTTPPSDKALTSKVETHLLLSDQRPDLYPPSPVALPVHLDLLNYHARVAARRRPTRSNADRLYRRCLRLNPSDGRAWLGLARLYLADADVPAAREVFRRAVSASPQNPHLLQAWGVLEERQGNPGRAKGLYDAAVRAGPHHGASWVALGQWHRRFGGDNEQARLAFERGAQGDPGNYYVWHVWGMLEKDCRRFPAARECFRRGVDVNPNNAATYVAWGSLEDALGNSAQAVALFKRAHVANPRNAHAYVSHAVAVERAGDVSQAQHLLETAVSIRPHDAAPRQALALLEWRRGRVGKARAQFRAALHVDDRHAPSWHAWARVEQRLGQVQRARELYQEAVWAAPRTKHVVRSWHAWGMLELEEGNTRLARRYFGHGLEIDAKSVPILTALAELEAKDGNMPRARDCLEICIHEQPSLKFTWRLYEELERKFGSAQRAQLVYERCVVLSKQTDQRLIVSQALPGDYAAGGMWFDALELKPTESAFESVLESGGNIIPKIQPFGGSQGVAKIADAEDARASPRSVQSKVTVSRRSAPAKMKTSKSSTYYPAPADTVNGSSTGGRILRRPIMPPDMPLAPQTPS